MHSAVLSASALDYYDRGWCVIPLRGKRPLLAEWKQFQVQRPVREQIEDWWRENPEAGIGLILGSISGVVRLDVDGRAAYDVIIRELGTVPETPTFKTPNNGYGWLFKWKDNLQTEVLWRGEDKHAELRMMCGPDYTVVPPSPHPDGGVYEWVTGPDTPLADLPIWIQDKILECRARKQIVELDQKLRGEVLRPQMDLIEEALNYIPADDYDIWIKVGMALHSYGHDKLQMWDDWSSSCPEKYKQGECALRWAGFATMGRLLTGRSIIYWAKELGGFVPPPQQLPTDMGNSERLVAMFGDEMLYCHPWSKWLVWDEKHWNQDRVGAAMSKTKAMVKELTNACRENYVRMAEEAQKPDDGTDRRGKLKRAADAWNFAKQSQGARRIDAALYLSQDELETLPEDLDQDMWLFNCANGTLDLRNGELREFRKDDKITKLCPTSYDRDAQCPRWLQFLEEVFQGKRELIGWLQKLFGYCLTGDVSEQILPIFWGDGANGKSTLLNVLFEVMGKDYAGKAPSDLLVAARNPGHPTNKATLFGMRMMAAIETGSEGRLDEVMVKDLTGDDVVSCRRMREDFWTFSPTHKLILATNHKPEVRGTDHAIWRRIRLVEFLVKFDEAHQDKQLKQKLIAEASGILTWMVDGCQLWQRTNLDMSAEIRTATAEYQGEENKVAQFLAEMYDLVEGIKIRKGKVVEKYHLWCRNYGIDPVNNTMFGKALREKGVAKDASNNYYVGLQEKPGI